MGPLFVVAGEPFFGHATHLAQGFEHVAIEHLLAIGSIEAFDVAVLHGLARLDKTQFNSMATRPPGQGLADELGPVVGPQHLRLAADFNQLIECPDDTSCRQIGVNRDTEGFAVEV